MCSDILCYHHDENPIVNPLLVANGHSVVARGQPLCLHFVTLQEILQNMAEEGSYNEKLIVAVGVRTTKLQVLWCGMVAIDQGTFFAKLVTSHLRNLFKEYRI